jgi:hypothetical protein
MKRRLFVLISLFLWGTCINIRAQEQKITRIWLSYRTPTPTHWVVNWESPTPGNAIVEVTWGANGRYRVEQAESSRLHHVEIPLFRRGVEYRYRVRTGKQVSDWHTFRGLPDKDPLKIAVIADWGYAPDADLSGLLAERPAIIMTCGDNVPDLYQYGRTGDVHCAESYLRLVDAHPELFRSLPFLPALGNHDKQIYPRGKAPPKDHAVYDLHATAFREFFVLPGDEWKWAFTLPRFRVRFLALDLNHIRDVGTTWQTCHAYGSDAPQYRWCREQLACHPCDRTIILHNGNNPEVRRLHGGLWGSLLEQSVLVISGSGYYAEASIPEKTPYLNASLVAGDLYPDAQARFSTSVAAYVLVVCKEDRVRVLLKTLDGRVLYETTLADARPENAPKRK